MKRRNFLGLFGAAATAPFLPAPALARTASFSAATVQTAIAHAQSRAVFSVWGLSRATDLTIAQAEALMTHLAERGILGPLQGATASGRWAHSKVLPLDQIAATKARQQARKASRRAARDTARGQPKTYHQPDLSTLIAHLRGLCLQNGMALHPRAYA